jgi:RNA polymerase sigma factor (TIGR02999 family)
MGDITELIHQARAGHRPAFDSLFQTLYPELRRIAHARLARNVRDTLLDTTVLLHECYLKFLRAERLNAEDRAHFVAYAATVMRSIVVDTLRARMREQRGGDVQHVAIDTELEGQLPAPEAEVLDVDNALKELALVEPRLARVVEMRYFGGMKETEIAQALGVTDRTVRRDWEKARLLLAHALRG